MAGAVASAIVGGAVISGGSICIASAGVLAGTLASIGVSSLVDVAWDTYIGPDAEINIQLHGQRYTE